MFGQDEDNQQSQDASSAPLPGAAVQSNDGFGAPATTSTPALTTPSPSEASDDSSPANVTEPSATPSTTLPTVGGESDDDDLLSIKQQALQQLSPLVGHLEQTPEEKFRTTMMMIQASDDQSLIKTAYEAAQQITDEKARAQALLDIVNEINYFTQQHSS